MRDFIVNLLKSVSTGAAWLGLAAVAAIADAVIKNTGVLDMLVSIIEGMMQNETVGQASTLNVQMLSTANVKTLEAAAIDPALFVQLIQLLWQLWGAFRPKAMAMGGVTDVTCE